MLKSDKAYQLTWELDHLEEYQKSEDYEPVRTSASTDAIHSIGLGKPLPPDLRIRFESDSPCIGLTDFPYALCSPMVMSERMIDVLNSVGKFAYEQIPVEIYRKDYRIKTYSNRNETLIDFELEPLSKNYYLVQVLETITIDDDKKSVLDEENYLPDSAGLHKTIEALDAAQIPPLFQVDSFTEIFISAPAREALKKACIYGPAYQPIVIYAFTKEVDVPVPVIRQDVQDLPFRIHQLIPEEMTEHLLIQTARKRMCHSVFRDRNLIGITWEANFFGNQSFYKYTDSNAVMGRWTSPPKYVDIVKEYLDTQTADLLDAFSSLDLTSLDVLEQTICEAEDFFRGLFVANDPLILTPDGRLLWSFPQITQRMN